MSTMFRASPALNVIQTDLGLLADLLGTFVGTGFNLIARPVAQENNTFFLELNASQEILEFTNIGGNIPDRGSAQQDVNLYGLHYLQRVADCDTHTALHLEPGLWLRVEPTSPPNPAPESYARLSTIPHGNSLLALSTSAQRLSTGPTINPVYSTPFTGDIPDLNGLPANPITDPNYLAQYKNTPLPTGCLPTGLDAVQTINNPALVLQAAITGQQFYETVMLQISTNVPNFANIGIANIPFVVANANAMQLDAIFWIERVVDPAAPAGYFIQLQYVQRVILDFIGIHWPHISVATLVKTL